MGNVKVADDYKDRLFRMIFVDKVRKYSQEQTLEDAVEQTIRECMEEDVMADFLKRNRAEGAPVRRLKYRGVKVPSR